MMAACSSSPLVGDLPACSSPVFDDLPDDLLLQLFQRRVATAAVVAQCSHRLNRLLLLLTCKLVRLRETGVITAPLPLGPNKAWINLRGSTYLSNKAWIKQAIATEDGTLHVVCSGTQECFMRSRISGKWRAGPCAVTGAAGLSAAVTNAASPLKSLLLVAELGMHRVKIFRSKTLRQLAVLTAPTLRNPSAVASDGVACYTVSSGQMVHVFDLATSACTAAWRSAADGSSFLCECHHGIAAHGGNVLLVDQRGGRVHMFSAAGAHLRSFGGGGDAPGRLIQPWGVSSCGPLILVSEHGGRRVQVFTAEAEPVGLASLQGWGALAGIFCSQTAAGFAGSGEATVLVADWGCQLIRVLRLERWNRAGGAGGRSARLAAGGWRMLFRDPGLSGLDRAPHIRSSALTPSGF